MDPIDIIKGRTRASKVHLIGRFIGVIEHIYQYRIFKDLLDLVATRAKEGNLEFQVEDLDIFDLDEGNCKTIFAEKDIDADQKDALRKRRYLITIKKITPEVIMHEIGHMIEYEISRSFNLSNFKETLRDDLEHLASTGTVVVSQAIKNIMVKELLHYPKNQQNSELFARYFQIVAGSKEVMKYSSGYGYRLQDVNKALQTTHNMVVERVHSILKSLVEPEIASRSEYYMKDVEKIKHRWADHEIYSIHQNVDRMPLEDAVYAKAEISSNEEVKNIDDVVKGVENSGVKSKDMPVRNKENLGKAKVFRWSSTIKSIKDY